MKVKTRRFGEIDVQPAQVFEMVDPLIGFEDTRFALIWDPRTEPVGWLQSTTTPQLCLPVADPLVIEPQYNAVIPQAECEAIALKRVEDALVLAVLVLDADPGKIRANLRAPIVLNIANHKAKQIILYDPELPIQHYLFEDRADQGNKEVADVGSNA